MDIVESLRERLANMIRMTFGRPPKYAEGLPADDDPPWRPPKPPDEKALVPLGPPKKPRPSSAVALPLPEPEVRDVDAIGRPLPDEGGGEDVQERRVG
jgi:hypothetical protein